MSLISFPGTEQFIIRQSQKRQDSLRESFRCRTDNAVDEAEHAMDHCKTMQREGFDTSYELEQMETWAAAFLLAVQTSRMATKRIQAAK